MVGRGELTQQVWSDIAPLLPTGGQHGGEWRDHRTVNCPTDLVQACQDDDRDAPGGLLFRVGEAGRQGDQGVESLPFLALGHRGAGLEGLRPFSATM